MTKKRIAQILVPLFIVVVIGGIWLLKNDGNDKTDVPQISQDGSQLPETLQGADFTLAITEAVDFDALAAFGLPTIIDYGSDSCIPCKQMAPVLELMNEEMYGKAFIKFADVWVYTDAADNVPVQVIPTQVLVNADGTPFVPSEELAAEIQFTMYSHRESGEHAFTVHQGGLTEEQMRFILKEMGVE